MEGFHSDFTLFSTKGEEMLHTVILITQLTTKIILQLLILIFQKYTIGIKSFVPQILSFVRGVGVGPEPPGSKVEQWVRLLSLNGDPQLALLFSFNSKMSNSFLVREWGLFIGSTPGHLQN